MRVTGLKKPVNQAEILKVLRNHLGDTSSDLKQLSSKIAEGEMITLDYDWALEQDLKDLGVRVN